MLGIGRRNGKHFSCFSLPRLFFFGPNQSISIRQLVGGHRDWSDEDRIAATVLFWCRYSFFGLEFASGWLQLVSGILWFSFTTLQRSVGRTAFRYFRCTPDLVSSFLFEVIFFSWFGWCQRFITVSMPTVHATTFARYTAKGRTTFDLVKELWLNNCGTFLGLSFGLHSLDASPFALSWQNIVFFGSARHAWQLHGHFPFFSKTWTTLRHFAPFSARRTFNVLFVIR